MSGGVSVFGTMCPCGGDVRWTSWGADCRGNDGGAQIVCLACQQEFNVAVAWGLLEATHQWKRGKWVRRPRGHSAVARGTVGPLAVDG